MKNTVNMGGKDDRGFVKDNYHIITCSYLGRGEYMTVLETSILIFCIGFMGFLILFTILDEITGK